MGERGKESLEKQAVWGCRLCEWGCRLTGNAGWEWTGCVGMQAMVPSLCHFSCSYIWQHIEIGYVQGMCDLLAPLLVILDDGECVPSALWERKGQPHLCLRGLGQDRCTAWCKPSSTRRSHVL